MSSKILTANFTLDGAPITGLTPVVSIYELHPTITTTNILVVNNDSAITEIGGGWYRYNFATYDSTKSYVFTFDGGGTIPAFARLQHGAADNNPGDVWEEPTTSHLVAGTTGLALAQIKSDTTSILLSGGGGLTPTQATMLLEIYRLYGLDPTVPLVVTDTSKDAGPGIHQDIVCTPTQTTVTRI